MNKENKVFAETRQEKIGSTIYIIQSVYPANYEKAVKEKIKALLKKAVKMD